MTGQPPEDPGPSRGLIRPYFSSGPTPAPPAPPAPVGPAGRDGPAGSAGSDGSAGWDRPAGPDGSAGAGVAGPDDPNRVGRLRPFLLTDGRVAASIPIEAQVVATARGRAAARALRAEHRDIVELCFGPLAVAEVAAHLGLHVGVVRILIDDLSRDGHLHAFLPDAEVGTDAEVLKRLIAGLRAIR